MAYSTSLLDWLDKMRGVHVLCVGDVMLDRYVYGAVDRVSPEAPIPVIQIEREDAMLGGVGNVVRNVVALGGSATIVAVRGDDEAGAAIMGLLANESRMRDEICIDPGRLTTVKTRYVARSQQLLRADHETHQPLSGELVVNLLAAVDGALAEADIVILSDYDKGVVTDDVIAGVVRHAGAASKPVLVDPKSPDFSRYRGVDLLTPNQAELAAAVRRPLIEDNALVAAAQEVIEQCELGAMLVTRGERGMSLVGRDGSARHLPIKAREVYDVSGAGDTVMATLALADGAGASLGEAAALANAAAGIVVGKIGTSVVFPGEIAYALRAAEGLASDIKICALSVALDRIGQWRDQGARIGFTNGCFDLLHPGHVSLLEQARAACDRLVIGLNCDESTRRLKGRDRPINQQHERAIVLASHSAVDLVVIFEEDTPIRLIESLRPDVLIKGADYQRDDVIGGDFVESYGGKVVLAKLRPGYSTTDALARLSGRDS